MLQLSRVIIAAPVLDGPKSQACRIETHGRCRQPKSAEFLAGSSSTPWLRRVVQPACSTGWGRTAGSASLRMPTVRAIGESGQTTFLSLEEAGLIEMTNLDMHEKFLARLTVSSLNLLRAISEQEGVPIEALNAGKICDWFVQDKEKRVQNIEEATLKWDTPEW